MGKPDPISDTARDELRVLYATAAPGRWETSPMPYGPEPLVAVTNDGARRTLATFADCRDARLAAAARNSLAGLFVRLDELKTLALLSRGLRVEGTVG